MVWGDFSSCRSTGVWFVRCGRGRVCWEHEIWVGVRTLEQSHLLFPRTPRHFLESMQSRRRHGMDYIETLVFVVKNRGLEKKRTTTVLSLKKPTKKDQKQGNAGPPIYINTNRAFHSVILCIAITTARTSSAIARPRASIKCG